MKAFSEDLRQRIVSARLSGQSTAEVAAVFSVSTSVVRRYMARHRKGISLAVGRAPGKAPRLRPDQESAFVAMLGEKSDWTLEQLSSQWQTRSGVFLPRSTMHDHVKRLKGRYKKSLALPENGAS